MNRRNPCDLTYDLTDYGPEPFVVYVDKAAKQNDNYRTALWTGKDLQMTLMSIPVGGDIGLEVHHLDQLLYIEEGCGFVKMGGNKDRLNYQKNICAGYAVFVPAGTWHNLINTGNRPVKLHSVYAPPAHPHGTIHETKEVAETAEHNHYLP